MLSAHLAAGYLLTKTLQHQFHTSRYLWIGLVASIVPDLDLIYFYFLTNEPQHHHEYLFHLPLFWLTLACYSYGLALLCRCQRTSFYAITIFYANIALHLLLDSYASYIKWLYPFFYTKFQLFTVPATFDSWIWNMVLHWSFVAEICIIMLTIIVLRKQNSCRTISSS